MLVKAESQRSHISDYNGGDCSMVSDLEMFINLSSHLQPPVLLLADNIYLDF